VSLVYLDSSALVKLVVQERESDVLRQYLATAGPLTSSILATVEVARAVARMATELAPAAVAVLDSVSLIGLDARIAARAGSLRPAGLRTLDAIHLATALELGSELTAFVSYDERLSEAAGEKGLPVVAPYGSVTAP
jgi:predicted nucleic acid-binding protein